MKRVLSLVLALVMVLGMIPTFAAEMTGAEHLKAHGFISGGTNGDLMEANKLTREQLAAVMSQLYGEEDQAAIFAQPANYTDWAKVADWAKPYVAYNEVNGWMQGNADDSFNPQGIVSAQQLAALLMKVLGYDFTWSNALAIAASKGLVIEGAELTRGAAFEAIWTAVSEVKLAGEEQTLGVKLGKLTPPAPVVTELAVKSVVANNLKTMVVEFNKAVDEDTITATTVKAVKGTATDVVADRILSEDGKVLTVVYTTGAVVQSTDVKLTIDGVKSEDGAEKITAYTVTNTVTDVAIPVVTGAAALNGKQIEVFFSEPMNTESLSSIAFQVINDIKINDVSAIAKVTPNFAKNSVVLELSTVLEAKM